MRKTIGAALAALTLCGAFLGSAALPAHAKPSEYEVVGGDTGGGGDGKDFDVQVNDPSDDRATSILSGSTGLKIGDVCLSIYGPFCGGT